MHAKAAKELAQRQLELDRKRTARFPFLLRRKQARMAVSPLAWLRGAAPLFYEVLRERKDLAEGPPGEGWIAGDLHVENFGAYRPDPIAADVRAEKHKNETLHVAFNLNDFDDAVIGPFRYDVLRLTTSLLLGGREMGFDGIHAIDLCRRLLAAYVASAFQGRRVPVTPAPVQALMAKVHDRSRKELLDARTVTHKGRRTFARGPRYVALARSVAKAAPAAFARYAAALPEDERPAREHMEIADVAHRIAGTGSLGVLRVAVLVRGKGGVDGGWIFDMKEQGIPSPAASGVHVELPRVRPAERVMNAARAMLGQPPRMMGTTTLAGASLLVKKLSPQDDKLDLRRLAKDELAPLASFLGGLVGAAHARGATKRGRAWTRSEQDAIIDRAIELAGMHEAAYLASCKLVAS